MSLVVKVVYVNCTFLERTQRDLGKALVGLAAQRWDFVVFQARNNFMLSNEAVWRKNIVQMLEIVGSHLFTFPKELSDELTTF